MSFLYMKPPKGKRVAVLGLGGGTSVAAADTCSREGLDVPPLSQNTQNELKKFISLAGASIRNPLDTGLVFRNVSTLMREMELVAADPVIDMLIVMPHLDMARHIGLEQVDQMVEYLLDFAKNNPAGKPVALVFHSFANDPWESELAHQTQSGASQQRDSCFWHTGRCRPGLGQTGRVLPISEGTGS